MFTLMTKEIIQIIMKKAKGRKMQEEKSYQEIRKDLVQKYKTEIVPKLVMWEKKRGSSLGSTIKILKWAGIIIGGYYAVVVFLAIISSLVVLISGQTEAFQVILALTLFAVFAPLELLPFALIVFFIWLFMYATKANNFQKEVKSYVMPLFCSCFPDLKWVPEKNHLTDFYKSSKIIPSFDTINYDDCFVGSYKGINYIIEEVDASRNGNKCSYPVFHGIIIRFNISKRFKKHTVIYPDILGNSSPSNDLHRTELEDVVFEKKYNVFTNDDVEARYIITPSLMEKLNNVKTSFQASDIYASFYAGVFFLGISTWENLFDYGSIVNSLTDPKPFIKMSEEIISILKLIDHFKLDQNIGM